MNTNVNMTPDAAKPWNRFLTCTEAYGAQRASWPETDRALFDQFAATLAGHQALMAARELDLMLVQDDLGHEPVTVSPDFMARLQSMPLPPQNRVQNYVVVMWKRGALLLILMAVLGFGNGYVDSRDLNRVLDGGTMTTAFGVAMAQ